MSGPSAEQPVRPDIVAFLRARLDEDEAWGLSPECGYQEDPARVLREVEAKRRIVDDYQETWLLSQKNTLFTVVQLFAAVYQDHPDYDPAWRPS